MTEEELDLERVGASIVRPDQTAKNAARDQIASAGHPRGRLDEVAVWLAAVQGAAPARRLDRVRMLLVAGDHGLAADGLSHRPAGATAHLVRDTVSGLAPVSVLARTVGVEMRPVAVSVDDALDDLPPAVTLHTVRRGSGSVSREDALTREEATAAVLAGMTVVDEEADAGADLLVVADVGRGAGVAAASVIGLLTRTDAAAVTSRGAIVDDAMWMRRCAAVRDAMRRGRPVMGDHVGLLATVGGADLAATTGVLLQAAARRTPVVLDGLVTAAAALVAQRVSFRAVDWWVAAHRSPEPAHDVALDRLGLHPLLDLSVRQEDGTGALLAVPLLRAAAALSG